MKKTILAATSLLLITSHVCAGQPEEIVALKTRTGTLEGTLLVPDAKTEVPVALIIAGSGPTDRDGNNPVMKNDSLKMLAAGLLKEQIATLRYDKRGIGKSKKAGMKESDLRFETYIEDAEKWIQFLKQDKRFDRIIVIGHSEGSLIGMIASQQNTIDRFISIAGVGQPADRTLREQLKAQPSHILEQSLPILDKLVRGETVDDVPPMLAPLFRPSVQPYMISWFKYDPQREIQKVQKPVLIVQGTTDIQVSMEDAVKLSRAGRNTRLVTIKGMNHIFKEAAPDRQKNIATYNQPELPVKAELIKAVADFIN